MKYPTELTTSVWVDYMGSLISYQEKINALATYHRRVEHAARHHELDKLTHPDTKDDAKQSIVREAADAAKAALADHPTAHDYVPSGQAIGRI